MLLVGCGQEYEDVDIFSISMPPTVHVSFEDALLFSTDVVIVRYVERRPFGETLIEFEFAVIDRVLGDAADTIFVYATYDYAPTGDMAFNRGTNYLLVLNRLQGATLSTHEDGYTFIHNLIINLDTPALSTMYNEPLSTHSTEIDFEDSTLAKEQIIIFVESKTENNSPAREHIRSDDIVDIVNYSPYILIVEISEPRRLVHEQVTRDWMETDIFFCTVVRALKGETDIGTDEISVIFFAYTVQVGEQHIVAVERVTEGSTTFELSSRNSLFGMEQLYEIMMVLD